MKREIKREREYAMNFFFQWRLVVQLFEKVSAERRRRKRPASFGFYFLFYILFIFLNFIALYINSFISSMATSAKGNGKKYDNICCLVFANCNGFSFH